MHAGRPEMDDALKRLVVPYLREIGFTGTMPNFRRLRGGAFDLLSIQHSQWGAKFCVEVGRCGPHGAHLPGRHVPLDKVRIRHILHRRRLGARPPFADHWFDYGEAPPADVAAQVVAELRDEEQWDMLDARPVG